MTGTASLKSKAIHSCILGCIYLGPGIPFVFVPRFLHFSKSLHPSVEGILGVDTKIERIKRYGVKALGREGQGSELRAQSSKLQASSIYLVRREARNVNKRRKRERTDAAQTRLDRLGGRTKVWKWRECLGTFLGFDTSLCTAPPRLPVLVMMSLERCSHV